MGPDVTNIVPLCLYIPRSIWNIVVIMSYARYAFGLLMVATLVMMLAPACSADYEEGPPLDVTVTASPSVVKVRQGTSASTTLTITNNEAETITILLEVPECDCANGARYDLDKDKITLAPNASEKVKLTVTAQMRTDTDEDWDAWLCISKEGQGYYNGAPNTTSVDIDVEVTGAASLPGYLVLGAVLAVGAAAVVCGRMRRK